MNNRYKGGLLVLLSALGFGLMPTFALFAYKNKINVSTLLFIRFGLASVLLFLYAYLKLGQIKLGGKDFLSLLLLGGVCYTMQSTLYFSAVKYIPSSLAVLVLYIYPIIVAIASSIIDQELISKKVLVSMGVSFIGLALMLGTSIGKINAFGVFLALGASVVYSAYVVLGNKTIKTIPPLIATAFVTLFACLGILTIGLFTGNISFDFNVQAWPPILGLTLFSTIISILFFFRGMDLLGATKTSILSMAEPLFAIVFSVLIFHDRITPLQLLGGIAILAGAVMIVQPTNDEPIPRSCQ